MPVRRFDRTYLPGRPSQIQGRRRMDHLAGPTVRELISELAEIKDDLRADRRGQGARAAERAPALRHRQAAVIRQLRRRRAALRRGQMPAHSV